MKRVGVLALQGAVAEHMQQLGCLGVAGIPIKKPEQLADVDALIIPGGESTAISRLIQQNGFYDVIRSFAKFKPVMGTCAGLILCGSEISGPDQKVVPLRLMETAVSRNGFGRQVDSFETKLNIKGIGQDIPAVFIRAPYIEQAGKSVTVLAALDGKTVMAECGNILVMAFHPELTDDTRVLAYFCSKMRAVCE